MRILQVVVSGLSDKETTDRICETITEHMSGEELVSKPKFDGEKEVRFGPCEATEVHAENLHRLREAFDRADPDGSGNIDVVRRRAGSQHVNFDNLLRNTAGFKPASSTPFATLSSLLRHFPGRVLWFDQEFVRRGPHEAAR